MSELTIDHHKNVPEVIKFLLEAHGEIEKAGIEGSLGHLIMLRASLINDCAFCIDMHVTDAKKCGESDERLKELSNWEKATCFSARERSAFAFVDALTLLKTDTNYGLLRNDLRTYFSEKQISAIVLLIGMINMWNRVGISNH